MVRRTRPGTSRFRVRAFARPGMTAERALRSLPFLMRSVCILPKFKSGNGAVMHLVRTISQAERTDMGIIPRQAGLAGGSAAAVRPDGIVAGPQPHVRGCRVDHRD